MNRDGSFTRVATLIEERNKAHSSSLNVITAHIRVYLLYRSINQLKDGFIVVLHRFAPPIDSLLKNKLLLFPVKTVIVLFIIFYDNRFFIYNQLQPT